MSNLTPKMLAEQAGACEMAAALKAMRSKDTQAERACILGNQLAALVQDGNPHAAAGASTVLLPLLERALGVEP